METSLTATLGVVGRQRKRKGERPKERMPQVPAAYAASQLGSHISNLVYEIKVKRKSGNALTQINNPPCKLVIFAFKNTDEANT